MLDYVSLEADLPPDDCEWLEAARSFAERHRGTVVDAYMDGRFPLELVAEMGEAGFLGTNLSGYGLSGASERAYGLVMGELEALDSGVRSMASVTGTLVAYPIHAYGSEAQRERWLPALGRGEAIGGFSLTEPAHGSDVASMETSAERDGDGYVLRGEKRWTTNAPIADVLVVWARDRSADGNPVRGFLAEPEWDGVHVERIDGKLSLRASESGAVTFDDAVVPAESVLPGVEGLAGPLSCLTQARYGIAWGAVGAARDCFEAALAYAGEREQFGRPIAGFQLQQEKLAEMATGITTAQLLAHRLADLKERGDLRPQQVSMAKRHNVRMARLVARTAREMLGGNGILADHSPMRHLANMETVYTYEGTHDIHSLVLGEDLTGLSAFE